MIGKSANDNHLYRQRKIHCFLYTPRIKNLDIPTRAWNVTTECSSFVILPSTKKELHESGYRFITVIAIKDNKPIHYIKNTTDVIHLDGIGGHGRYSSERLKLIQPSGWSIECLPNSGAFHLWPASAKIQISHALSSLCIYSLPKGENQ